MNSPLEMLDSTWKAMEDLSPLETLISDDSTILDMPDDLDNIWDLPLPAKTMCTIATQTDHVFVRRDFEMKVHACYYKGCESKSIRGSIACPLHEQLRCVFNGCSSQKLYGVTTCEDHTLQTVYQEWDIRSLYQCKLETCWAPQECNSYYCLTHERSKGSGKRKQKIKTLEKDGSKRRRE